MTGKAERTAFRAIAPDEVRQGDLLLVTQIPGEPLGQLMQRLDGTCFSHSGIAVRTDRDDDAPATHLASALAKRLPSSVDMGGVRWDPFAGFWPSRDLYCIPMSDEHRATARSYLGHYRPEYRKDGSFSFTKLVTVAAALRSVELHDVDRELGERLFRASCDVAEAWAGSSSYYCAELVANAYGRTFTRRELAPPKVEGDGIGNAIDEPRWLAWAMSMLADEIDDIDGRRGRAWARLFALLSTEDWDFLERAVNDIATSGGIAVGDLLSDWLDDLWGGEDEPTEDARVPSPLDDPRPMDGLRDPDAPLPHALVTPRMLWAAFGRESIRRVEQPT